jgi:hypothetical protein
MRFAGRSQIAGRSVRLSDTHDVPATVASGDHSPAFAKFLSNWFGDTTRLTHGGLDITLLNDLTHDELSVARELIRRNLHLKLSHIIQGAAALDDAEAVPILRAMLEKCGSMTNAPSTF